MTLKTSFFNKGIYKSTFKRYSWGMIAYFLVLFFSTTLILLLDKPRLFSIYDRRHYIENPLIIQDSYMVFPMLTSIAGTCIASLVLFRFIHSKKQAVFIHALPVSRKANYISTIAAGITLMAVPVLLNGAILIFMSFTAYGTYFGAVSCLRWIAYNLLAIYMMFSCAVFCANLTGNGFAAVAINVILHSFLVLSVSVFCIMAEVFVYGFTEPDSLLQTLAETNFVYSVFSLSNHFFRESITASRMAAYVLVPIIFYVASYFLYKKRKLDTTGDVASYSYLNSIFKYGVTFLASMFGFAVFSNYIDNNPFVVWVAVGIIITVVYFALEMILAKTLKVLYSWKGYAGFILAFAAIVLVFSKTSFFGYETKIPQADEIEKASVYSYYYGENEPFTNDAEVVGKILETHKEFIKTDKIPLLYNDSIYHGEALTRLHIKYRLRNGKTMHRVYPVTATRCNTIMNEFYKYESYKKKCEEIFIDDSLISRFFVNHSDEPLKDYEELLGIIRQDVSDMSFDELKSHTYPLNDPVYNIRIEYTVKGTNENEYLRHIYMNITSDYKRTCKWFEENGYAPVKQ